MILKLLKEHKHLATWITVLVGVGGLLLAYKHYSLDVGDSVISNVVKVKEPALEGIASFHSVNYPRFIENILDYSGWLKTIQEKVVIPEELSTLTENQQESLYKLIETYINEEMGDVIGRYGLTSLDGYMSIRINNLTTRTLEDVSLQLPFFFDFAEIYRKGSGSEEISEHGNQIEFGELKPEETISVTAWMDDYYPGFFGEKMKLLHRNGIGPVYMVKSTVDRGEDK